MLHVATYSTNPDKVQFLLLSGQIHGLTIENLATNPEWLGWQQRLDAVQAKLEKLPEDDIFCFLDAYDVLVNADAQKILDVYHSFNAPVVFGAEMILFPEPTEERKARFPPSPTVFRYLNAGVSIGRVRDYKNLLRWGYARFPPPVKDDQRFYQDCLLENPSLLCLDYQAKLVANMVQIPWKSLLIEKGLVQFVGTGTSPCFIHFNGMSNLDKDHDMTST